MVILILSLLGLADSIYLTLEHYGKIILPCHPGIFADCGKVLRSTYSEIYGIPMALLGVIHYGLFSIVNSINIIKHIRNIRITALVFGIIGVLSSVVFMYIQFFIIGSLCIYCTISALISFALICIVFSFFEKERKYLFVKVTGLKYRYILKTILFYFDPEFVHETILGFGYMTIGTITNMPYQGNPTPRLGRLPRSKSLLVNKGFKNEGADEIVRILLNKIFEIPIGISIGRTNSPELDTQKKSVTDIITAFKKIEKVKTDNSYYELNISCPNLIHQGEVVFDEPKKLDDLLKHIDKLKLKKPVFIKMPIDKSDKETLELLKVISKHSAKGVIFGNLQKDKSHPLLHPDEAAKFKKGYYSGKPTFERSNELIKLTYRNYKDKLVIIGCGGVFSAEDAYKKIKLGATLVQLITGLVYNGPQLVAEINMGIEKLLQEEGYKNISQAVGTEN